jgi:ComF family protein
MGFANFDIRQGITSFLAQFNTLIFPPKCLECGTFLDPDTTADPSFLTLFCQDCHSKSIFELTSPYCDRCGIPFKSSFNLIHRCQSCIEHPLRINKVRGCYEYKGIVKKAIALLKYQSKLSAAAVLEQQLFTGFMTHFKNSQPDLILPIPLHRKKMVKRQFNQSYLLVRNFTRIYGKRYGEKPEWQLDLTSLIRTKPTLPQTGLDTGMRKKNLENAFTVCHPGAVKGKQILLVDDVLTTGATCNEAARVLLKSGAKSVDGLVWPGHRIIK